MTQTEREAIRAATRCLEEYAKSGNIDGLLRASHILDNLHTSDCDCEFCAED